MDERTAVLALNKECLQVVYRRVLYISIPSKKDIGRYYEKEYPRLYPSLHIEDSKFKASEILLTLNEVKGRIGEIDGIISLGCGAAIVSKEIAGSITTRFIIGCDISSSVLGIARKLTKTTLLIKADCEEIPIKDRSAELVLLIDIIEHLAHPEKAILEASRISKRWICIRVPLLDCLYRRIKTTNSSIWKADCGHLWTFNLASLNALLKDNGLKPLGTHSSKPPINIKKGGLFSRMLATILLRILPETIYRYLLPMEITILAGV